MKPYCVTYDTPRDSLDDRQPREGGQGFTMDFNFVFRLAGAGGSEVRMGEFKDLAQDPRQPDDLKQWRDRFHSCPCCGSQTDCFNNCVLGDAIEKLEAKQE